MPTCTPARSTRRARGASARCVQREADFYGAMDGAGKFVKGDAIAALVIVALNLAGGVAVGHGLPRHAAARGAANLRDPLDRQRAGHDAAGVSCFRPRWGLMVTRVAGEGSLGVDLAAQLSARPDVLRAAGAFVAALAFVPALPAAAVRRARAARCSRCGALAQRAQRRRRGEERLAREAERGAHAIRRPEIGARAGRRRCALGRLRRRSGRAARSRRWPKRCSTASAKCGARSPATSASCLPGVRLRDDLTREPATLRDPRARPRWPVRDACASIALLAVARRERARADRGRADARAGLRLARGMDRAGRARSAQSRRARSSSIRSRSSARTSPKSRARTRPSCSGGKSFKRCSSTCARPCRRS